MAIPCAPPPCGANDKQTYGKKTEKPRDSAEKSAPAPWLFHCEYFQNAARLILTTSPPLPAGRVFTGTACGGGSPMRKGVCYAMLYYAMLCVPKYTFSAFMADFCNI